MRLYRELATWWPLLSPPEEYAEAADYYRRTLVAGCERVPRTLLELGSGGGNNALHLKAHFAETVLVDLSPGMLQVSRGLNPECEHVEGDMRTVRLGRLFDCVFLHDAVSYMATRDDLRRAVETAFAHCAPGGAALFAPDHVRESFHPATSHGGHDGDGRGLRYLMWSWDPDPADESYLTDFALLLRERDGSVTVEHDRHREGLFSRQEWLDLLAGAGFVPSLASYPDPDEESGTELFLARKPGDPSARGPG